MKNFAILIESKKQTTRLVLTTEHNQRKIEEITTYLKEDCSIYKISSQTDVYYAEISLKILTNFFNNQLNALIEFYRVQGEFKISIV